MIPLKIEITIWQAIIICIVLTVLIGYLVNFLPGKSGKSDNDPDPGDFDFF